MSKEKKRELVTKVYTAMSIIFGIAGFVMMYAACAYVTINLYIKGIIVGIIGLGLLFVAVYMHTDLNEYFERHNK